MEGSNISKDYLGFLKGKLDKENFEKLSNLENKNLIDFIGKYVEICNPKSIFVRTDTDQDIEYIREKSLSLGEEQPLKIKGHTINFNGYFDQARDKKNTKYLVRQGCKSSYYLNSIEKEKGLTEIRELLKDIMADKEMMICFFCLGPLDSPFSILAMQITDSTYVAHSEDILYRPGYEQFKKMNKKEEFFKFVHSAGELENNVSKNVDKRRIYIDLENELVYSVNTQYAGNTVGLKKLALRLAINKASSQGWLAEHMFIMSVSDKNNKKSYFCGAYPSMCGKTSTAMVRGETIVGDDIAYLRIKDNKMYAVNVERGIFGIVKDVNAKDDPAIFNTLSSDREVIFSNVLIDENDVPYWIGKGVEPPHKGVNFSGEWFPGKTDPEGEEISPSHKNARYTLRLKDLENVDENLENPEGVLIKGLIYGGRDSDTSVPVEQAFSWDEGIIKAASLESETTAATLGQEGVRVFNPMSNVDFLSIPLKKYIESNLNFGKNLEKPPFIFTVNYFLRDKGGKFLNGIHDKRVWLKWISLRADFKVGARSAPTGLIPKYEDLSLLFKEVLDKDYTKEDYIEQFTLRIPENLAKIERIQNIYNKLADVPQSLLKELDVLEGRLKDCQKKFGDYVNPDNFVEESK